MDTRTGKIYEMNVNEEELLNEQKKLFNEALTKLKESEYKAIKDLPEDSRPLELALLRFIEERKKLGAPHGIEVKNAFRLGYQSALKDQGK